MHLKSDHSLYNTATTKDMIIIFRHFLCVIGFIFNELGSSSAELVKCKLSEKCAFYPWMHWETCQGACGKQTQLRLRKFCCPDEVTTKTASACLQACNMDITTKISESKPCIACDKGRLSPLNSSCICDPTSKGLCCEGNIFLLMYFLSVHFNISTERDIYCDKDDSNIKFLNKNWA